jgi:DNA mismatch repair protein MutL
LPHSQVAEPLPFYDTRPAPVFKAPEMKSMQTDLRNEAFQVLGQLKATYILCQDQHGLAIIDQHAAHERIVYEKLRRCLQEAKLETQTFLIPPKFEFSIKESRTIQAQSGSLHKIGVELEFFGGNTFILRSIPSLLVESDYEAFLRELIPLLEEEVDLSREKVLDPFLMVMACHGAIRAGRTLSFTEMEALVRQLNDPELLPHCPHGRPIIRRISIYDIEKMFKRVI